MAKGQSPLLGFNMNVRHKGRTFHIQTEDSGVQHPHVITHLFADGGRILKTNKTPYGELLALEDWVPQVKAIMQEQHKAMFTSLRNGEYDSLIDPNAPASTGQTGQHAAVSANATGAHRAVRPSQPAMAAVNPVASPSTPSPPANAAPPSQPAPADVSQRRPPSSPGMSAASTTGSNPAVSAQRSGRYAPIRSPDVLGSFKPKVADGGSIFGDDLMSEKSLDEVILAYLADDLDDPKKP